MPFATLSIDLIAKLASLEAGMDKAVRIAEKDSARIAKAFNGLKLAAAGIGSALAAGLGGAGIVSFVQQTNEALLAIKDLAEGTGSSVENVSALENALRANNRQLAEAQPILVKFNGALKEADGKNGISQALKAIGLSAEELRRQDPVEALRTVAKALQGFSDDGNKARIVQELFGKSVADVIPLLNDLADTQFEATKGIREAAEEADKFEKNLARLTTNVQNAGRAVSGELVKAINELFDVMRGNGPGLIEKSLAIPLQAVSVLGANVAFVMRGIGTEIGGIAAQAAAVARLDFTGARTIGEAMREDAAKARAEFDALERRLMQIGVAPQASYSNEGRGRGAARSSLPAFLGGGTAGRAAAGRGGTKAEAGLFMGPEISESLRDALRAIEQTDVRKVEDLTAQLQELLSLRAAGGDTPALAEAITDISLALDELRSKSFTPAVDIKSDFLRSEKAAYEETDEFMRKLKDQAKEVDDIGKDLGLTFSSAFEDAIVGGKGLREVLAGIEQDIIRIITRKLVTEPLGNAISGAIGSGGIGSMLGDIGSFIGNLFGGFFADGGFLPPGRWGIAGEHGPEPIFGGRTGKTVVPAGGGGRSITVNVRMPAGADRRTGAQFGADIARALNRSSARNN